MVGLHRLFNKNTLNMKTEDKIKLRTNEQTEVWKNFQYSIFALLIIQNIISITNVLIALLNQCNIYSNNLKFNVMTQWFHRRKSEKK